MTTALQEFTGTLNAQAGRYGVSLNPYTIEQLGGYYERLLRWNPRLHLVAPCTPAEFATRHVLESLMAAAHIPEGARLCDVGSGGGLPIIPCLVARPDVRRAWLLEASLKKAVYLREALSRLKLQDKAVVLAERFERADAPEADVLTCRALERFTEMYAQLVAWSARVPRLLLFGGNALGELIERDRTVHSFAAVKMPDSEQRFLFVIERRV